MAIHADLTVAIQVVQNDILFRKSMLIRRDIFAKDRQPRITIRALDVTELLVVGSVLLDDEYHVPNSMLAPHCGTDLCEAFRPPPDLWFGTAATLRGSDKKNRMHFNYKEVVQGKKSEQNIILQPGDTVVVP